MERHLSPDPLRWHRLASHSAPPPPCRSFSVEPARLPAARILSGRTMPLRVPMGGDGLGVWCCPSGMLGKGTVSRIAQTHRKSPELLSEDSIRCYNPSVASAGFTRHADSPTAADSDARTGPNTKLLPRDSIAACIRGSSGIGGGQRNVRITRTEPLRAEMSRGPNHTVIAMKSLAGLADVTDPCVHSRQLMSLVTQTNVYT